MLRRNYDLVATAGTAGVFLALDVPWPLWAIWGVMLAYQLGNRAMHLRDARDGQA